METIDHDPTLHTTDKGDASLAVQFYMGYIKDEVKSIAEGRYIAQDVAWVKIFMPGDRTNIIERPVRPSDMARFPQQYSRFKNAQDQRGDGTPIEQWPLVSRGQCEELKYLGFSTVEQLALMSDTAASKAMGLTDLRAKAKAFLEIAANSTAPIASLTARAEEAEANNKRLDATVRALNEKVEQLLAKSSK